MATTKITIDTKLLGIAWTPGETYTVDAEESTFFEVGSNPQPNIAASNVFSFTVNTTTPSFLTADPAPAAINVAKNYEFEMLFDRFIEPITGTIKLYEVGTPDILKQSFDVTTLDYHDDKLYIDVFGLLNPAKTYYLTVDNNALKDYDGLVFPGISNVNILRFTTASAPTFPVAVTTFLTKTQGEGSYKSNDFIQLVGNTPLVTNTTNDPNTDETLEYTMAVKVLDNSIVQELRSISSPAYKLSSTITSPLIATSFQFSPSNQATRNNEIVIVARSRRVYLYSLTPSNTWTLSQTIIEPQDTTLNVYTLFSNDGLMLIIGYPTMSIDTDVRAGQVRIYTRASLGTQFTLTQTINRPESGPGTEFGSNFEITPDKQFIFIDSSPNETIPTTFESNRVGIYKLVNGSYIRISQLIGTVNGLNEANGSGNFGGRLHGLASIGNNKICIVDNFYGYANFNFSLIVGRVYIYEKDVNDNWNLVQTITGATNASRIQGAFHYENYLYLNLQNNLDVYEFNATSGMYEFARTHIDFGAQFTNIHYPNIMHKKGPSQYGVFKVTGTNDPDYIDGVNPIEFEDITPDGNYAFNSGSGTAQVYQLIVNGALDWNATTSTLTIKANKTEVNQALTNLNVKTTTSGVLQPYDGEIKLQYDLTTPTNNTETRFQRIYRVD